MCSGEKLFGVSFRSSLNCFSYSVVLIMGAAVDEVPEVIVTASFLMDSDGNILR